MKNIIQDERIRGDLTRFASHAFVIVMLILTVSLDYRFYVLRQSWREYWGEAFAYTAGLVYFLVRFYARGIAFEDKSKSDITRVVALNFIFIMLSVVLIYFVTKGKGVWPDSLLLGLVTGGGAAAIVAAVIWVLFKRWHKNNELE